MTMAEETQVLVKFFTRLPANLRVPEAPVAVPSTLKRYGLSQIINHLLALDPPRPFDFLIGDQLIRKSLEQHLLDHSLSAESTLEVEYVPAVVPPQHKQSSPHDDWVSSVDASRPGTILSGSYDGLVRVWNGQLECTASFTAHSSGVTCVRFLPQQQGALLLTAGKDQTAKLWRLMVPQQPAAQGGRGGRARDGAAAAAAAAPSCSLVATYSGHEDSVEAVAASPSGERFCSSGWDGRVLVWETGRAVEEAAAAQAASPVPQADGKAAAKRRKVAAAAEGAAANGATHAPGVSAAHSLSISEPSARLRGHLHCVASVAWPSDDTIYSGGWDHSVRRWDAAVGSSVDTYNGSKAVCSVASSSASPDVVAFGSADRCLRLWDTRARQGESLAVRTHHGSHTNWVTAVAWSPTSQHHLATASHDGTVKMWDVRSGVPLGTLADHTDKVLCVGWVGGGVGGGAAPGSVSLLSGGADCQLRLYAGEGAAANA